MIFGDIIQLIYRIMNKFDIFVTQFLIHCPINQGTKVLVNLHLQII